MKTKLSIAFAAGLLLGLAWRPYTLQIASRGEIVKQNHITGRTWVSAYGQPWSEISHSPNTVEHLLSRDSGAWLDGLAAVSIVAILGFLAWRAISPRKSE